MTQRQLQTEFHVLREVGSQFLQNGDTPAASRNGLVIPTSVDQIGTETDTGGCQQSSVLICIRICRNDLLRIRKRLPMNILGFFLAPVALEKTGQLPAR